MTTMRERWIPLVNRFREAIDARWGLRRYTLYIRRRTPLDGRGAVGAEWHTSDELIDEKPRVRRATARDLATGAGRVEAGDWVLDRITPRDDADTAGNWLDVIDQRPESQGEQIFWVLVGPGLPEYVEAESPSGGGLFTRVHLDATKNFGWVLVLRPATGRVTP